jgi:homoserine kinase type II
MRFIHAVIQHAARAIDFLPLPIKTHDGQSFVTAAGHLWEIAPWMPGTADYELAPSYEKLRAAMTALAQFHNAVADFQPSSKNAATLHVAGPTAIPRRLARLRELTPIRIQALSNAINETTCPELAPLAREFLALLPNAIPRAVALLEPLANVALPLQPCLRDIWHDHVLFTGNQVTGLIDFGAIDIDTPATDIARLLGSLVDNTPLPFREGPGEGSKPADPWQTALAAYSATRPLSPNETLTVFAIDAANPILAGCNWINWIYIDQREFDKHEQVIERFRTVLKRVADAQR